MEKRRGQALVEFALIAPMVFLMIFGLIYGGIMFIDYLNLSNDARTVARQIAVASNKATAIAPYKSTNAEGGKSLSRFYKITMTAKFVKIDENGNEEDVPDAEVNSTANVDVDVVVTVIFKRDNKDLPWIVYKSGFPPEYFALKYRMKVENNS